MHGFCLLFLVSLALIISLFSRFAFPFLLFCVLQEALIYDEIDISGVKSNMPGAGGETHIFYFEALRAGECTINMTWADIRDDDIALTESYTIIIED